MINEPVTKRAFERLDLEAARSATNAKATKVFFVGAALFGLAVSVGSCIPDYADAASSITRADECGWFESQGDCLTRQLKHCNLPMSDYSKSIFGYPDHQLLCMASFKPRTQVIPLNGDRETVLCGWSGMADGDGKFGDCTPRG